jgi:hypothetical protein
VHNELVRIRDWSSESKFNLQYGRLSGRRANFLFPAVCTVGLAVIWSRVGDSLATRWAGVRVVGLWSHVAQQAGEGKAARLVLEVTNACARMGSRAKRLNQSCAEAPHADADCAWTTSIACCYVGDDDGAGCLGPYHAL